MTSFYEATVSIFPSRFISNLEGRVSLESLSPLDHTVIRLEKTMLRTDAPLWLLQPSFLHENEYRLWVVCTAGGKYHPVQSSRLRIPGMGSLVVSTVIFVGDWRQWFYHHVERTNRNYPITEIDCTVFGPLLPHTDHDSTPVPSLNWRYLRHISPCTGTVIKDTNEGIIVEYYS
jgi:hypothetical protein